MRTIFNVLLAIGYSTGLLAQIPNEASRLEYEGVCNDVVSFTVDKTHLDKVDSELCVNTRKGKLIFKDTLVEAEHPNMRSYDAIGVNLDLNWALIEETRLTETKYIIVDLESKSIKFFDSRPIVSPDGEYVITITEPQDDQYLGLEIYRARLHEFESIFRDNNVKYIYDFGSGKWCNRRFYVLRKDAVGHEETYISFTF